MNNNTQNLIIPFCIYHYIDSNTKTYMGYIGNSISTKLKDGTETYICPVMPKTFTGWLNAGFFYAVKPIFRPIPTGMRMFCAKINTAVPYGTLDLEAVYDPFNIKDTCVYFSTYNQPTPNTEPLYFHKLGNNVFPSFDPSPPYKSSEWSQTEISPIYVMTPKTVGDLYKGLTKKSNNKKVNFQCVNAKCIPFVKNIPDMYKIHDNKITNFQQCETTCNDIDMIPHLSLDSTNNIHDLVVYEKSLQMVSKNKYIIIFLCIICLIIIISIILFYRKKK